MVLTLVVLRQSKRRLLLLSGSLIVLFPILLCLLDYEQGWNFETLHYTGFWTVKGFFRNLFFNGFHPVIPWTTFMIFGLWLGRQALDDKAWLRKIGLQSFVIFVLLQLFSYNFPLLCSNANQATLQSLFSTAPMPPMPLYLLSGMASSTALITACILLGIQFSKSRVLHGLVQTGKMALTLYMAHILLGVGLIETCFEQELGTFSWHFSLTAALLFNVFSVFFANLWLHFFSTGPFEALMRRVCG
jgi:uncharacterized membrane protein YeiB